MLAQIGYSNTFTTFFVFLCSHAAQNKPRLDLAKFYIAILTRIFMSRPHTGVAFAQILIAIHGAKILLENDSHFLATSLKILGHWHPLRRSQVRIDQSPSYMLLSHIE